MNRADAVRQLKGERFDVLIIGGGATGLGCALDAAARGHRTGLLEAEDFAKATSSRSTKLIHGGVRYLQQGNFALVREALRERTRLRANAPTLVRALRFFIPAKTWWERAYYRTGLRLYDSLAGASAFPHSSIEPGGVAYWDAQFDDARLAIAIARTAVDRGAALANYVRAVGFECERGRIAGVEAVDTETQERFFIRTRVVVNAAGIFADEIRKLDDPRAAGILTWSRGSHIVASGTPLGREDTAVLVPRTSDGRVVFAIPWHGHTLIGTTDIAAPAAELEPQPAADEIAYLLATINGYVSRPFSRADIRCVFAGLRPLVNRTAAATSRLSREHIVEVSQTGLVTIAGGKWTTYRKMAQDAIDAAEHEGKLEHYPCPTENLPLHDETPFIEALSEPDRIRYFAQYEMARTLEDVLARRTRTLFIDAGAAVAAAPACAHLLAQSLNYDLRWESEQLRRFTDLAARYTLSNGNSQR
jgi:glycerol-3-phosphate dehydrogenase